VVTQAVEAIEPLAVARKHELVVSVPSKGLVVDGDEVRLTQVVSNLLGNAARYTPDGGRVEVTAVRENGSIELRVRDSGVGIDPALLPHVFDTFVQGDRGPDRAGGGLGLGLALVRTLTTLHGGTVTAQSDGAGRGSLFTVKLPASRLPLPAAAPVRAPEKVADASARRILVIDDNDDAAGIIASVLRRVGHDARVANHPTKALALAEEFRPHIALLDIGLPAMDGYALASELRTRLGSSTPLLVALTGYGRSQDKRRSADASFALHLVKPIELEDLLRHIADLARVT
jgi:CheY-like chemotaxis protein/anti-sigma regulatory factor (Ser/Thr protein kinase)